MTTQDWLGEFLTEGYVVLQGHSSLALEALDLAESFYRLPTADHVACHVTKARGGVRGFAFGESDFEAASREDAVGLLASDTAWAPGQSSRGYSSFDFGPSGGAKGPLGRFLFAENLFPSQEFAERARVAYESFAELGRMIALAVAESVGRPLEDEDLSYSTMRLLHYSSGATGWSKAHSDYEFFALIAASATGLEVQAADGRWVSLVLEPGELALLAGDCMESFSGGRVKAVTHRVALGLERYSVPFFQGLPLSYPLHEVGMTFGEHIAGRLIRSFPHLREAHEAGELLPDLTVPAKNPFHRPT